MASLAGAAEAAAYAVKDVADSRLTARPYNRFESHSSLWWLVPSTEWPAFRFGKLFFDASPLHARNETSLHCGFYVEKGLAGGATLVYPPTLVMDSRWTWLAFLNCASQDFPSFPKAIRLVVAASYINPNMAREFSTPEGFLAAKKAFSPSRASFELTGGRFRCLGVEVNEGNPEIAQHFSRALREAASIAVLFEGLQQMPQRDWVWIDFYAGPVVAHDEATAGADSLWHDFLRPWTPWLR